MAIPTVQTIQFTSSTIASLKDLIGNPWLPTFVSSFLGAFFAFFFLKIGGYLDRISTRQRRNYDALVQLEYLGNDNLQTAHDDIFIADDILRTSSLTRNTRNIQINFNTFEDLNIRADLLSELLNIDFVNVVAVLNIQARKTNSGMKALMKSYEQINQGIFAGTMNLESYITNLIGLEAHLNEIKTTLGAFIEENINMMATARVLMNHDRPRFTKLVNKWFRSKNKPLADLKKAIESERVLMDDQIKEVSGALKRRMDELMAMESGKILKPDPNLERSKDDLEHRPAQP